MDFTTQLRCRGLKSTPQRTVILSEIMRAGHIDIDSLHLAVNKSFSVPLGTLYRAITELGDAGMLKSVSVTGLKTHYEIAKDEHAHFVCKSCNSIVDFNFNVPMKNLKPHLPSNNISSIALTIYGVCQNCDLTN